MELDRMLVVIQALEDEGVDYVLVGGGALNLHGLIRATEDMDIFLRVERTNVDAMRRALRRVWDDPSIDEITFEDLAGEYGVIRYGPPGEDFVVDIMSRLGEAFNFDDLESETIVVDDVAVRIATADTLYKMKRDTVRAIDRQDADALKLKFGIEEAP
jgi:hypothetical protein